jgi:phosphatidylserine/phosphatidylglycerophosphate/cardiolipin synthase-like enzyme
MRKVYSNGPQRDYIVNPYSDIIASSANIYIATPYFTEADDIIKASNEGHKVSLLVGLNSSTSPIALKLVQGLSGVVIRYFTHRFHAKVYIADNSALVGSSNLTDGGAAVKS